jgi:hypothetical protein
MFYYLAHFEGKTDVLGDVYWRAPFGDAVGILDLRTIPQQESETAIGYGVFAYKERKNISDSIFLGNSIDVLENKTELETIYGIFQAITVKEFLWEILTVKSDPTGQTAPKPLRQNKNGDVNLFLAGERIKTEKTNSAHTDRAVSVFREDYKINKALHPLDTLQRWTGATMLKYYGRMNDELSRNLLPSEYSNDGWRTPQTTINDNFNRADDATGLGTSSDGDWSWANVSDILKIVSNRYRSDRGFTDHLQL